MGWILLIVALFLVIDWFAAQQFHEIAKMKGHPETKYLWWCFWMGIVGWAMVIALPDRSAQQTQPAVDPEELPEL